MNGIKCYLLGLILLILPQILISQSDYTSCFNRGEYRWTQSISMPYREALIGQEDTTNVLVVYLHGSQARGIDNEAPINTAACNNIVAFLNNEHISARVLVPQCSVDRRWHEVRPILNNYMTDIIEALIKEYAVEHAIQHIYLVGESMGGVGAWRMLNDYPKLFDAALIAAACPPNKLRARKLAKTPICVVLGEEDSYASLEKAQPALTAITDKGGDVQLEILPLQGHLYTCTLAFNRETFTWLFAHKK